MGNSNSTVSAGNSNEMVGRILVVDALSAGKGRRSSSRDSIGCGPRTVAGVFENHDIDCRIIRAEVLKTVGQLRKFEHIAISAMTMDLPTVQRITSLWRHSRLRGKVIIGGPISSDPKSALENTRPDVLVVGEGELTLDELVREGFFEEFIDLSGIKGICYWDDGSPVVTSRREYLTSDEMRKLGPSTSRIVDYAAYAASRVYVEVVRGCSNFRRTRVELPDGRVCRECGGCDAEDAVVRLDCPESIPPGCGFCSVPSTWGPPRSRPPDIVIDEVRELISLDVHRIVLEAPGFLDYMRGSPPVTTPCHPPANVAAIKELLEGLAEIPQVSTGLVHIAIENIKACLFTREVAEVLSTYLPSSSPNIGLETGSEDHSRLIGKCGTPNDVVRAVRISREYGMTPYIYFIYGLPDETPETVNASIRMMKELSEAGAERIILYGFRALPGSAFESFPEPSPKDPLGQKMRKAALKINRKKKTDYVDETIRCIAAEPSWSRRGYTMYYPLGEGPIITAPGGFTSGTIVDIRITEVLSEGLLLGEVVRNEKSK